MSAKGVDVAFGGAAWLSGDVEDVEKWLTVLDDLKINRIDTAAIYGASEDLLGKAGATQRFTIDTKHPGGFTPELPTKENVIKSAMDSLEKLKTDSVDVYYLHSPDRRVNIKETLSALNELHQQGVFKRLGLSNFLADEVEEAVRIAKENNFVAPSIYQGNYSAVARRADTEIFPTIRKHNMAFVAYSPIAGGFLSKSKAGLTDPNGRFGAGQPLAQVYNGMYNRPGFLAALDVWEEIAEHEKISRAELAYRWVVYHSKLDASKGDFIVVGARNAEQLKETMSSVRAGPLSDMAVKKIDELWESVKDEAGLDNLNSR